MEVEWGRGLEDITWPTMTFDKAEYIGEDLYLHSPNTPKPYKLGQYTPLIPAELNRAQLPQLLYCGYMNYGMRVSALIHQNNHIHSWTLPKACT